MLQKFNEIEKNNKFIFFIGKCLRRIYISIQNLFFEIGAICRHIGMTDKKYTNLKKLENSHIGERCFVLATGPSLTIADVESLKNEFTFGMNSICLLYDMTQWRPSFFGIQDIDVYNKLKNILYNNKDNVWVSSNISRVSGSYFNCFPLNSKYNYYDYRYTNKLHVRFSSDAYAEVYDAYSITFSLIQIAIFMGFKEIYLLGCDCNQAVGVQNHFIETGHVEEESKLRTSAERNIFSHTEMERFAQKKGVKIYNATRGGNLEVYKRVILEEVLNTNGN